MSPSMRRLRVATLTSLLLVGGCVVGPDYRRPDVQTPPSFRGQTPEPETASFADRYWWEVFEDSQLQSLVRQALSNNLDLQVAIARVERARALVDVAASEGRPQVGYEAGVGGEREVAPGLRSVNATDVGSAGAVVRAAWELDLWGRIRRSNEAARANLLAQEDVRRGVMTSLVADVATAYFRLAALDRELEIAEESAATYRKSYDFYNLRFEAGRDSRLPVDRAKANQSASEATIAQLKQQIGVQENAIAILLGVLPQDIVRGRPLTGQTLPPTPVGATTALLQRRPDIQQAEHVMMRANAEIGVAVANFFPRIGLSALLGGVGMGVSGEAWEGFGLWSAALSAAGPIYSGGRLKAQYEERKAFWDETVAEYRKTVIVAFQETSDALIAQRNLVAERAALEAQVEALRRSSGVARTRFDEGRASYFEVLESDQQLYPAETALARVRRDQLLAVVNLYRALGGGWRTPPAEPVPTA